MGNCNDHPSPDTTNQCTDKMELPHFCTLDGVAGDKYRQEWCAKIGGSDEWEYDSKGGSCQYDDCNPYKNFGSGCCGGCCGIAGRKVICRRKKDGGYKGNPVQCCLNDNVCRQDDEYCFTGENRRYTCDPRYRDITSTSCKDSLLQYCSGTLPDDNPNSNDWINRWINPDGTPAPNSCLYALRRNLYSGIGGTCSVGTVTPTPGTCTPDLQSVNSDGFKWGSQLISTVLDRYQQNGLSLGSLPGTFGYNSFQDFLYTNVCCPHAGICQSGLQNICSNHSGQQLRLNPNLANWCGCHLPLEEYREYRDRYSVKQQCTPYCNRITAVPITGTNGQKIGCDQTVCIIDNTTIDLVSSQVQGAVNITQVCGNCGNGSCVCTVDNNYFSVVQSTIGGNLNINNACGVVTCTQTVEGPNGSKINVVVPCGTEPTNPYEQVVTQEISKVEKATRSRYAIVIIVIALLLFLILLLVVLFLS